MGELADDLAGETPRTNRLCGVTLVLERLEPEDRVAVEGALRGTEVRPGQWVGIEATTVQAKLAKYGYAVGADMLRRHRKTLRGLQGGCSTCRP